MRIAIGLEYCGVRRSPAGSRSRTGAACRTRSSARSRRSRMRRSRTIAAGRTDAGVHATMQVVHFDVDAARPDTAWVRGVNANLPADVAVLWARPVAPISTRAIAAERAPLHLPAAANRPVRPALLAGRVGWYHRAARRRGDARGGGARSSARTTFRRSAPRSARRSRRRRR